MVVASGCVEEFSWTSGRSIPCREGLYCARGRKVLRDRGRWCSSIPEVAKGAILKLFLSRAERTAKGPWFVGRVASVRQEAQQRWPSR